MKLNKGKCKLHLSQGNPKYKYRLGEDWLENSPAEKNLRVLVDESLTIMCTGSSKSQLYSGLHQEAGREGQGRQFCPSTLVQ